LHQRRVKLGNDSIEWRPGWIERRIIYDAAMRVRIIRERLDQVLSTRLQASA
jgi:hypothetical protein